MRLSALRTHFCAAIENSIFFDRNLPTDFDNLFARQSEIARDARGVSHHCRKQRLLPARRLFAFPNKAFHQSSLKGERLLNSSTRQQPLRRRLP